MIRVRTRLLSTASNSFFTQTNASRVLIAAAVTAPIGFAVYKYENDPEFLTRAFRKASKPAEISKAPLGKENNVAPSKPVTEANHEPAVKVQQVEPKIDIAELDELERKLVPTHVTFSKEEVAEVEKKIEESEKAAQAEESKDSISSESNNDVDKPEKEVPETAKNIQAANENAQTEVAVVDEGQSQRQAVDAVREIAKKVESEVLEASRKEIENAKVTLRADIERVLSKDLSSLDENGLRERVVQLTLELEDRTRWEAIRLHEMVNKSLEELSKKYTALLREQEAAYENVIRSEVMNAAMQAAATTEERLSRTLQERLAHQKNVMKADTDILVAKVREEERARADAERKSRMEALKELENKLGSFDEAIRERDRMRVELTRVNQAVFAAFDFARLTLIEKTSTSTEVEKCLRQLLISSGDPVVTEALEALPHRVFASGISSLHQLSKSFEKEVVPELIQGSIAPVNPSLAQQALAKISSALMITSKPSASPMPDDDSIVAQCSRIQLALDAEDLVSAVRYAEDLPAHILDDSTYAKAWLAKARDRLKVEATIRLLALRLQEK